MATPDHQTQEPLDGNATVEVGCESTTAPQQNTVHPIEMAVPRAPQLEEVLAVAPSEWNVKTGRIKGDSPTYLDANGHSSSIKPEPSLAMFPDIVAMAPPPRAIAVRSLYRHDCQARCCPPRWSAFAAFVEEQSELQRENATIPILHFHTYEEKHWATSHFIIQNNVMKNLLVRVFEGYQDLDMELENWTFKPPYMPIVHRWGRLNELRAEITDSASKEAAGTLIEFLTPILAPPVNSLLQTRYSRKIDFESAWQIFPPGELVVTRLFGVDAIRRVLKYEQKETYNGKIWVITTEHVDWDGESCGYATATTAIESFNGFRHVISLPIYPLSFTDAASEIKSKMIKRGRKFELLRGYNFCKCIGKKVLLPVDTDDPKERQVSGRVIIDTFAYYRSEGIVKPELRPLSKEEEKNESTIGADSVGKESIKSPTDADSVAESPEPTTVAPGGPVSRHEDFRTLADEHCLLATPWLIGFDLKTKEWAQFCVDDLEEVVWNEVAFHNLVLPGGEKELAWEFVENKKLSNQSYDFLEDKGRGIIILMFGPPGVGKTYTAEAVAERAHVPLFSMSAGMLGTDPQEVEESLEAALELCRLWNAIMLLDEADVFLSVRTDDGLARNELVSIFLTKLEYYQGILFLTTNRVTRIDYAFQSRVDLFLPYSDLEMKARKQIWENFINHAGREKFSISENGLERLSEFNLNGREIKNLIKSAQLLSFKSSAKVSTEQLGVLAENRVKALCLLDGRKC